MAPKGVVSKNGVEKVPVDAAVLGGGRGSEGGGGAQFQQNKTFFSF